MLSHAKSIAKANYEIRKDEAEARARPLEAALTFVDRRTFTDAPEQTAARNLVTQESLAHDDWFDGVETILTQLELADNPPVNVCLNQAQILCRH